MGCQLIYDCLHITVPLDSSSGEQLEGKVLSLCTASGSYYIQPLWYRHICIKGPPLSNSIPFPMCSSLTPSVSYKKGRTTLKKTPKIYDCHNPGNQVIDWSSRKLDLYSRQGFSFFLLHKKKQNPTTLCLSSLSAVAWQSPLPDSRRFMLPLPSLQPCYREKKKRSHGTTRM